MKTPHFIDRVAIQVSAGNGGNGIASFRREKFVPRGGPSGGDGGRGGHVIIEASKDVSSLLPLYYQPQQRAEHGGNGRTKEQYGAYGADCLIKVPCGTEVRDEATGEWVGEVLREGEQLMLAKGGRGGLGNVHFKSSTHQAPRECTPGEPGEVKKLLLELKLISDAGLVGYPNAGKSTLLQHISQARPKVAPYPFTTLNPVIGTVEYEDFRKVFVADIPGLIEGAHEGVGLGHDFLRHIERTRILVFVLDMAGVDGRHPVEDYRSLRRELALYREELLERPYLVVANKMDLPESKEAYELFVKETGETPLPLAAAEGVGTDALKQRLYDMVFGVDASAALT